MYIKGKIGGRSSSFGDLLHSFSKNPDRCRILKTIFNLGYYTDGIMFTRLLPSELETVSKNHYDYLFTDSSYKTAEPFDIVDMAVPKYLRVEIEKAIVPKKTIKKDDSLQFIVLQKDDIKLVVEDEVFFDFYHRIEQLMPGRNIEQDTSWWMSKKDGPIVVIDTGSFYRGRLLGCINQVPVEREKEFDYGKPKMRRFNKEIIGWLYQEIELVGLNKEHKNGK